MAQSIATDAISATPVVNSVRAEEPAPAELRAVEEAVDRLLDTVREPLIQLLLTLRCSTTTPMATLEFERSLWALLLGLGRELVAWRFNTLEPRPPTYLYYLGERLRLERRITPNNHVATLFGTIRLMRRTYRAVERGALEHCVFPLELALGLVHGATPAFADALGRAMAESGASQRRVLRDLHERHGVRLGAPRLRKIVAALADGLEPLRMRSLADKLLEALRQAEVAGRRALLVVGRDGITLRQRRGHFQVATVATISLLEKGAAKGRKGKRRKRRRTTVYLAFPPEFGQEMMTRELTGLIEEVLRRWTGAAPKLAYVADAGGNESGYYESTLRRMLHPLSGAPLHWTRVVDFYHVSERVWAMAKALFGDTGSGQRWAESMLSLLKRPNGARRVLKSAAKHHSLLKLSKSREQAYRKARKYISRRLRWLDYATYKSQGIPLGSGVTEAGCRTIFTQRLKLSGQRWSKLGTRWILELRVHLLSGVWQASYNEMLRLRDREIPATEARLDARAPRIAA